MSASILVEEIGLDLPPIMDDAMADDNNVAGDDVEMQQRMDEDSTRSSSRSNGSIGGQQDCDMNEDAPVAMDAIATATVEAPMAPIMDTASMPISSYPYNSPHAINIEHPQLSASQSQTTLALDAIASPSQSDYIESPAVQTVLPDDGFAAAIYNPQPAVTGDTAATTTVASATVAVAETAHFAEHSRLIELARLSWGCREPNYLRGCVWSPDGTCLLTPVNRAGMHVVELPPDLYSARRIRNDRPLDLLTTAVHVPEMGTVYDYCWYPFMHSSDAATSCWLSTQQHGPIQMWDAFSGRLRCSYRGYDAVDEVEAAVSVCFSADADAVIGGYRKSVKIFRTAVPGRDCTQFALRSAASCMAVHARQPDLLAVGGWSGAVMVHDTRSPKLAVLERLQRRRAGGVTQMRWTPDGRRLWVGARKDGVLACWDVRMAVEPVVQCRRTVRTNQRVQFDVSGGGRWLVSGDTDGVVRVWDLDRTAGEAEDVAEDEGLVEYRYGLHHDCCNGVSLHPWLPVLATSSGQHHFAAGSVSDDDGDVGAAVPTKENSLIMWWYGDGCETSEAA